MAEFTWKFSEREKNGLADIHLYGFQSAGTAIDQPREVIQKLLYHHLMYFTRIGDFTWVSDCEELVGVVDVFYYEFVILLNLFDVPVVLLIKVIPF